MDGSKGLGLWCVVAATIVFLAGTARAQSGTVTIGGGAGAAVPVGDFEDDFNDAGAWAGWVGVGLGSHADLMGRFQQSFHDQKRETGGLFGDSDVTLNSFTLGPKVFFTPPGSVLRPWAAGEIGWTRIEADDAGQDTLLSDDDRFALNFGGGLDIGGANWAIGGELRYYRAFGSGDEDDVAYLVPMGSFTYRIR